VKESTFDALIDLADLLAFTAFALVIAKTFVLYHRDQFFSYFNVFLA